MIKQKPISNPRKTKQNSLICNSKPNSNPTQNSKNINSLILNDKEPNFKPSTSNSQQRKHSSQNPTTPKHTPKQRQYIHPKNPTSRTTERTKKKQSTSIHLIHLQIPSSDLFDWNVIEPPRHSGFMYQAGGGVWGFGLGAWGGASVVGWLFIWFGWVFWVVRKDFGGFERRSMRHKKGREPLKSSKSAFFGPAWELRSEFGTRWMNTAIANVLRQRQVKSLRSSTCRLGLFRSFESLQKWAGKICKKR